MDFSDTVTLARDLGPWGVLLAILLHPPLRRMLGKSRPVVDDGESRGRMAAQVEQLARDLQALSTLVATYQSAHERSAQERHKEVLEGQRDMIRELKGFKSA